jgi:negative regulator of sigma E activity
MLPAHLQELMTAAVDGELSAAERRLVDKLLRDSEEARVFHARLASDAQRLKRLPRAVPADDLAASVMNMIDERCIMPTPLPTSRGKRAWDMQRLLPWISMATAAGVVICVSLFSYLYFAATEKQLAKQKTDDVNTLLPGPPVKDTIAKNDQRNPAPPVERVVKVDPNPPIVNPTTEPNIVVQHMTPRPEENELVPVPPRVVGPDKINVAPSLPDSEPFRLVPPVRLSVLLPLKDLDQPYPKAQVRNELKKDEVIRIDLFCKDGGRATEIVQAALRSRGQHILVDGLAQERLKKKVKSEFAFYSESLTADEIAQLLEHLGADDKKAEAKKAGEGQFDTFLLAPFCRADLNDLAKLLGIPPGQIRLPKAKLPTGAIDPRKSLESITAAQLAQNLPKSASRGNEKVALVLPYGAINHFPQNSKEIKSFLDKRGERKNGVLPMMLVLRTID